MFQQIQHIGYLTPDLDAAVTWFQQSFGAVNAGGGNMAKSAAVPSGGRNAFLRFGRAEAEIIEPEDKGGLATGRLTMHHVGYVVADMDRSMAETVADIGVMRLELESSSKGFLSPLEISSLHVYVSDEVIDLNPSWINGKNLFEAGKSLIVFFHQHAGTSEVDHCGHKTGFLG